MQVKPEEVELVRRDYCANGGWETFLAYEDVRQDILVGLLRLRRCFGPVRTPHHTCSFPLCTALLIRRCLCICLPLGACPWQLGLLSLLCAALQDPKLPPLHAASGCLALHVCCEVGCVKWTWPQMCQAAVRTAQGAGPPAERQAGLRGRSSVVRELHVYGTAVAVHARDAGKHQHQVRPRPPPFHLLHALAIGTPGVPHPSPTFSSSTSALRCCVCTCVADQAATCLHADSPRHVGSTSHSSGCCLLAHSRRQVILVNSELCIRTGDTGTGMTKAGHANVMHHRPYPLCDVIDTETHSRHC